MFFKNKYLYVLLSVLAVISCSDNSVDPGNPPELPIHYVSIDIDDIFMPNWDSSTQKNGTVKMTSDDVKALIKLSYDIRSRFNDDFRFSIGFNCGYFDSTNSGDSAFLTFNKEFLWFDHLVHHNLIKSDQLPEDKIDKLFAVGRQFAQTQGIQITDYQITPKHEGIWPPYDPLYNVFEKYGIKYTSTFELHTQASYGNVKILPRYYIGVGSGSYSLSQISQDRLKKFAEDDYKTIMENRAVILYSHQANFAVDRLGEKLIRILMEKLSEQKAFRIVFLPAGEVVRIIHEQSLTTH